MGFFAAALGVLGVFAVLVPDLAAVDFGAAFLAGLAAAFFDAGLAVAFEAGAGEAGCDAGAGAAAEGSGDALADMLLVDRAESAQKQVRVLVVGSRKNRV